MKNSIVDEAGKVTIEQYNKELDQAMERVNGGEFTTLEALEREMQSWQNENEKS
jgi:predicted transcriptional regulator